MSNNVFANGRELSCKSGSGKSICAFPDVCMTPPENPATPPGVPIPYPNTGMTSDCTSGSRKVKISKKEVMLKNSSYFKKSMGDEAGSAAKKGVVSSVNRGKVYFTMWSMDVKFEGKNVVRHLDLTTHNHGSAGNSPPWPFIDSMDVAMADEDHPCHEEVKAEQDACAGLEDKCDDGPCEKAQGCMLVPYVRSGSPMCCAGKTAHHVLPNSLLQSKRGDSGSNVDGLKDSYTDGTGACVCVDGASHHEGTHGLIHEKTQTKIRAHAEDEVLDYDTAKTLCSEAHAEVFNGQDGRTKCSKECTEAQIEGSMKPHREDGADVVVRERDGKTSANLTNRRAKRQRMSSGGPVG